MAVCASVQTAHEGHRRDAMIAEGIERGRRNGVDGFGSDEVINVDRVGVGGVLRAGARPQRTLHARTFVFEFLPTRTRESLLIKIVGEFGVGNGGFAFELEPSGSLGSILESTRETKNDATDAM